MNASPPNFEVIRQTWENDPSLRTPNDLAKMFNIDTGYMRVRMREEKWPTAAELGRTIKPKKVVKGEAAPPTAGDLREWLSQRKAQLTKMAGEVERLLADAIKPDMDEQEQMLVDARLLRMAKAQRLMRLNFENAEKLVDIEGKMSSKGLRGDQSTRSLVLILQEKMQQAIEAPRVPRLLEAETVEVEAE